MGMFIVAGLPARWITTIVGVGAVGAVLLSISSEYRLQRLHVWFDPWLDPQGKGYAQLLLDHPVAVPPEIAESVS